jgi:hypothetical protein
MGERDVCRHRVPLRSRRPWKTPSVHERAMWLWCTPGADCRVHARGTRLAPRQRLKRMTATQHEVGTVWRKHDTTNRIDWCCEVARQVPAAVPAQ